LRQRKDDFFSCALATIMALAMRPLRR
jgi:hypothetical protein